MHRLFVADLGRNQLRLGCISFRLPEFDAVIKLEGLEPRDVYDPNGDYNVRWRAG